MKEFKLHLSDETLKRHLDYDPSNIVLFGSYDNIRQGDVTIIAGNIYYYHSGYTTTLRYISHKKDGLWKMLGFKTQEDFITEFTHRFGDNLDKYHHVIKLYWLDCKIIKADELW